MLNELYPTQAARQGLDGRASISCTITVQGTLRDCKVVDEAPAGMGFGNAALGMAPQLLFKPALMDGRPVESTINIPVKWVGMAGMRGSMPPSRENKVFRDIPWRAAPTYTEVLGSYPTKARATKMNGVAVIDCKIGKDGRLSNCNTIRENPTGYSFASAARSLAPRFVAPIDLPGGDQMVGARTHINVTYAAASLDDGAPVVGKPKWTGIPRIGDIAAVAPAAAKAAKVYKARVIMECTVVVGGAVEGCVVKSQEPPGLGYDQAALKLSAYFRLAVWTDEGLPTVGGVVRIPLRFDLESAMAEAAAPPSPKP